jgi:hypothetical protein
MIEIRPKGKCPSVPRSEGQIPLENSLKENVPLIAHPTAAQPRSQGGVEVAPAAAQLVRDRADIITAVAHRKRRERIRDALELETYEIETHRGRLIEAMLDSGRLTEAEALDQSKVEAEVTAIIEEWVAAETGK